VLYLNDAGKAADASDTGPIAKVARSGRVVLAIDARQWGESAYPACSGYSCKNHGIAVRALLLGRNLVGMQTRDALRALDYLASRPEVDATNLAVIGKTNAGVPALFAAFLDARVRKVNLTRAPRSYLSVANTQRPGEVMGIVINKVLADFDLRTWRARSGPR
jgi:cephalosporin-C deacetylase-like acetyl esterase